VLQSGRADGLEVEGKLDDGKMCLTCAVVSALALTIAAWSVWGFRDSSVVIQTTKWRKIVTIVGLLVLSADAILSGGYVFYEFSARIVIRRVLECRRSTLLNRNHSRLLGKRTGG